MDIRNHAPVLWVHDGIALALKKQFHAEHSAHILVFHKMCVVVVEKDYKESCTCILGSFSCEAFRRVRTCPEGKY